MKKLFQSKNRIFTMILVLIAIASLADSCTKSSNVYGTSPSSSSGPGPNEVWIQGMAFTPATINITAGTTITWTNKDAVAHTVTSTTGIFNSGSIAAGKTFSQTFAGTGSFPYACTIHSGMSGTVIVN